MQLENRCEVDDSHPINQYSLSGDGREQAEREQRAYAGLLANDAVRLTTLANAGRRATSEGWQRKC